MLRAEKYFSLSEGIITNYPVLCDGITNADEQGRNENFAQQNVINYSELGHVMRSGGAFQ